MGGSAVDGSPLSQVFSLEVCSDPFAQLGGVARDKITELELITASQQRFNYFKIFLEVGGNVELASGYEGFDGGGEEFAVEESAFVMALLGPRVGKVYVQRLKALAGRVADDEIFPIAADHTNVS